MKKLQKQFFCITISTDVLLVMRIFSSSPYAAFNPKEWDSLSKTNYKFSDTPIKIKKRYFNTFKNTKSPKKAIEKNNLPKQIQLAFN